MQKGKSAQSSFADPTDMLPSFGIVQSFLIPAEGGAGIGLLFILPRHAQGIAQNWVSNRGVQLRD